MAWMSILFQSAAVLAASIPQYETNGKSWYGTLDAPTLPNFLTDGPLPHGAPWGATKPGNSPPHTGVIRSYDLTVTRAFKAPDGFNKSLILINDQFPGPLIEANWGDTIQVKVTNNIVDGQEGLSLHWHGQPQKLSPWYDGVPGVSQCPIAPGGSFTYAFRAESYGSSWYHSHISAQYSDGLFGPMVIYGPQDQHQDYDLGPIMLNDYEHDSYLSVLKDAYKIPTMFPNVDNNLINGKGIVKCDQAQASKCTENAGLAKFQFKTGKIHRLRLMNTGSEGSQKFSIDNHRMTVIANDYVPIKPYVTDIVTLGIDQRTDVLVKATGKSTDSVWMRADIDVTCLNLTATNSHALAAIYYPEADKRSVPKSSAHTWQSNECANDPLEKTTPIYPSTPSLPATSQVVNISLGFNASGIPEFFVNGSSFRANYNSPLLLLTKMGNLSYPYNPEWNVWNFGSNTSIRLVIKNYWTTAHPMHLHGHDMWVLAEGVGEWNGKTINPSNPQRRDTQLMRPAKSPVEPSYLVIQWNADNPGVWPLHCHTSLHVSDGLLLNIQERPDRVRDQQVPYVMAQTCRDWAAWSGTHVVPQIDSGL